jgi:hypothetical protein
MLKFASGLGNDYNEGEKMKQSSRGGTFEPFPLKTVFFFNGNLCHAIKCLPISGGTYI